MNIGGHDVTQRILIVAEIGNNHEGSVARAEDMIALARESGADAVKFQTFRAERYVSRCETGRFERLKRFELSEQEFVRLRDAATRLGLIFLSTPFDPDSARFLNSLVPAFKIASGDNNHKPLLEQIAAFGKPIILSTGLADIAAIRKSRAIIERIWKDQRIQQSIAVLHCVSSYPVPPAEANLGAIAHLRQELGGIVGYSDHCLGIDAAVVSAALGARIVEKHFTFDKSYSDYRDHQLSANPVEFEQMCHRIRETECLIGCTTKTPQACEKSNERAMRRSIVASRRIPSGSLIDMKDLDWIRPGTGLPPGDEFRIVGKRTTRDIAAGEVISMKLFGGVAE